MISRYVTGAFYMERSFNKDRFLENLGCLAIFWQQEKVLTDSIRRTELEIRDIRSKISAIKQDMIKSVFMIKSIKKKRTKEIENLENDIRDKQDAINEVKEQIRALNLKCFGSDDIPHIYFGEYPQKPNGAPAPLEWDVLMYKDNRVLIVTTHVIEQMQFAKEIVDTPWKNSIIRKWLNNEFYDICFTKEEKALILEKENANPENHSYKTAASENTRDKVFIPSIKEVKRFSDYDSDRIAYPTEYAVDKGVYVNGDTNGSYWWLRSNGGNMYNAAVVNFSGYIFEYGFYVNSSQYGVRPAVWISLI